MTIDLNEEQVRVVIKALDVYSRLHLGKFFEAARIIATECPQCWDKNIDWRQVEEHAFLISWHLMGLYPREPAKEIAEPGKVALGLCESLNQDLAAKNKE